ncbi:MAG TPA: PEPxxWA-CTERM sorting domain-containing protein [Phenylobacterium sp.]|nr:PEPxxWA-CTERM sorting domain-containing protein [Phenylobacterium sp.]HLZ76552.1 PEPxxWA-CTERM sorting domain-containing protein [Phenylobacterium sp.]
MKSVLFAGAVALAALAGVSAHATTKIFTYSDLGSTVATGSFTYANGDTGVLGYGDLTAFTVTVSGVTYNLAQVATLTDYVYFGYDTAGNDFVTNPNTCGFAGCGFQSSLSAINSSGTFGYFFNPVPGGYLEYSTGRGGSIDKITISGAGTPEPATWALMLMGFGGLGASLRARRTRAVANAA